MSHTNFWQSLPRPIYALAPMANVTDCAFREIIAKYGKPDIFWTEFVSCDGLQSPGRDNIMIDLRYSKDEHPILAQIFGSKPENFYKTAQLIKELGFDGVDINMGCPDKNVEKQHAGAAMMKDPALAQECIRATMEGAGGLPVSIKTRLGFNKNELDTWLPKLLETKPAAITLHCRTRKEMSLVPAHWDQVKRAVEIRDEFFASEMGVYQYAPTLILGNGDVRDLSDAFGKVQQTGCDGIMIGRGIFGNPWLFSEKEKYRLAGTPSPIPPQRDPAGGAVARGGLPAGQAGTKGGVTIADRLRTMVEHTYAFEKMLMHPTQGGSAFGGKPFDIMKKHYKAYVNGFDGAKELRIALMETKTASEVEAIVQNFLCAQRITHNA